MKDRQIAAQAAIIAELSADPDDAILDEMIAGYERSLKEMKLEKLINKEPPPRRAVRHDERPKLDWPKLLFWVGYFVAVSGLAVVLYQANPFRWSADRAVSKAMAEAGVK